MRGRALQVFHKAACRWIFVAMLEQHCALHDGRMPAGWHIPARTGLALLACLQNQRARQQAQWCSTADHKLGRLAHVFTQYQLGLQFHPAAYVVQAFAGGFAIGCQRWVGDGQTFDMTFAQQCLAIGHGVAITAPQHQPTDGVVVHGVAIGHAFIGQAPWCGGIGRQQYVERCAVVNLCVQLAGGGGADFDAMPCLLGIRTAQLARGIGKIGGHRQACDGRRRWQFGLAGERHGSGRWRSRSRPCHHRLGGGRRLWLGWRAGLWDGSQRCARQRQGCRNQPSQNPSTLHVQHPVATLREVYPVASMPVLVRPGYNPRFVNFWCARVFESLTQRLSGTIERLRGRGRLSESNISEAVREVRIALLEADVALPVVQALIQRIKVRAVGQEVLRSLSPGQVLVKIVRDELAMVMGAQAQDLNLNVPAPAVILMAGLQGAGKTTTVAKLAKHLKEKRKKKVMVVSADVYRPAAIEQLQTLAGQVGAIFFPSDASQKPEAIVKAAIDEARKTFADVLIVDTAGRTSIDAAMMAEIKALHAAVNPVETLFVVDSMTGQDAAVTAKHFGEALPLTGVVLTKTDGDARGGAALSVRYITGKPIKFVGVGEKPDGLDVFHPERAAGRILDMGDVLSLVEQVESQVDQDKAKKLAEKVAKGKKFDLNDMRDQLEQMQNMGGLSGLMDKLPGMGQVPESVKQQVTGKEVPRMIAIINSMTKKERRNPDLLNGSRRARVARGSGLTPADVNKVLKQYQQMEKMMGKLGRGGMKGMMRGLSGMMGGRGGMPMR